MVESSENLYRLIVSLFEIIGVFLLAIEAMKLENFRRLRDRVINPFYNMVNPTIKFVENTEIHELQGKAKLLNFFREPVNLVLVIQAIIGVGILFVLSIFFYPRKSVF